jgi:hypothetical protein
LLLSARTTDENITCVFLLTVHFWSFKDFLNQNRMVFLWEYSFG